MSENRENFLTPEEARKNAHTLTNQRIVSRLVEREVYHRLNETMDALRERDPESFMDAFTVPNYEEPCREEGWLPMDEVEVPDDWEPIARAAGWIPADEFKPTEDYPELPEGSTFFHPDSEEESDAADWRALCGEDDGGSPRIDARATIDEDMAEFYNPGSGEWSVDDDWQELADAERIEPHLPEVYEFWAVSDFLARKLREAGEIVAEVWDFDVWGRCCTGQAIAMDCVMIGIAADMEILTGQRYAWEEDPDAPSTERRVVVTIDMNLVNLEHALACMVEHFPGAGWSLRVEDKSGRLLDTRRPDPDA